MTPNVALTCAVGVKPKAWRRPHQVKQPCSEARFVSRDKAANEVIATFRWTRFARPAEQGAALRSSLLQPKNSCN